MGDVEEADRLLRSVGGRSAAQVRTGVGNVQVVLADGSLLTLACPVTVAGRPGPGGGDRPPPGPAVNWHAGHSVLPGRRPSLGPVAAPHRRRGERGGPP